ncbi:MAG TPA: MOSC N-terminal beta barrel domain-containing protein [Acidimicrobiales bacterium]|nr:MOSC N-terminal beta barrel domain-containing protein [Acidimicrobiales bacterium]
MRVVGLQRYPVKSLQGEALTEADVGRRGIVGDRAFALRDASTGVILTGRRDPDLLFGTGRLDGDGGAVVTLPDGTATADDHALSTWLGKPVHLVAAPAAASTYETPIDPLDDRSEVVSWQGPVGTFHDSRRTQVSIVATGDLGDWDPRRFRANVLVEAPTVDHLVGQRVRLGTAVLDVVKQIDRCVMVTRPQPGLERDLDVFRRIRDERGTHLAVGALVVTPGRVGLGDALEPVGAPAELTAAPGA